ncbi:CGCGG family rSAM-modified RiPP protein [Halosimplex aquaticum]|uniref:CGCGG family rSAM-modified RiPP protein n=1 Tax=Halosimplex aquaticum TaxID=3026162 RepID=A0ABD5Y232_9EURY|nr:CGCGG family rSAM-modified RiPP protein [Halosimplex aquaticum]
MSNISHTHDGDEGTEPVTDRTHESAWAADLEAPEHAADRGLVVEQAVKAVRNTVEGTHVQLVTHEEHGHPSEYLTPVLEAEFNGEIDCEYICQCNCGGHILRVPV